MRVVRDRLHNIHTCKVTTKREQVKQLCLEVETRRTQQDRIEVMRKKKIQSIHETEMLRYQSHVSMNHEKILYDCNRNLPLQLKPCWK